MEKATAGDKTSSPDVVDMTSKKSSTNNNSDPPKKRRRLKWVSVKKKEKNRIAFL